jgi:hypothetical protein
MNTAWKTILPWYVLNSRTSFSPASIPNLALWLDAADASTITVDGSNNVSEWRDKSGGGRNVLQATTLLRPSYGTQTQNGLPLVVTNAAGNTRLESAANIPTTALWGASRQTGTLFRVIRSISGTISGGIHQEFGIFNNTVIFRPTQILNFRIGGVNDDAVGGYGGTLPTGNMDIMAHVFNLATPTVSVRRNGSVFATLTPSTTTAFSSGVNQFYSINWSGSGTTSYHAEHIHYARVLTSDEITQVETYLRTKWATA